ncbi:MAG: hypothetical protein J7L76_07320 [Spirochaetaceae bacterium]|nr:hypothetical protein [Spirochaetaceae bacterium]
MKKLIILTVLVAAVTGFAAAGGLVFQLGAGYHSSYIGELPSDIDAEIADLKSLPLGVGGYVGLGYGFGEKKMLSLGAEFAPSWDFSLNPTGVSNFSYQGRGFLKFKPAGMLTATGFFGYGGNLINASSIDSFNSFNPVFGGRITLLFLYAEYAAVLSSDWNDVAKHEIGLGFAFFK